MEARLAFISYANQAVGDIVSLGFTTWEPLHRDDPLFTKFMQFLSTDMFSTWSPWPGFPERTYAPNPDDFCTWLLANGINYTDQTIPAEWDQMYRQNVEPLRDDGQLKKRYPWHINYIPSEKQNLVRQTFLRACNCFNSQPYDGGVDPADEGPRARTYWYDQAAIAGKWYYNYFMELTLKHYYDEAGGNLENLPYTSNPDWCKWLGYCELWSVSPMLAGDSIMTMLPYGQTSGTVISNILIKAAPDFSYGNEGNPDDLNITFWAQPLDAEQFPAGELTAFTINGVGTAWHQFGISVTATEPVFFVYIAVEVSGEAKDFYLYMLQGRFYKYGTKNYKDFLGIPDNSFGFDVIQGNWAFQDFVEAPN